MVTLPAEIPDTTPELLTVAKEVLLLLHVPPEDVLLNGMVCPVHRMLFPTILAGNELTVTGVVTAQPPGIAYVIVADPEENPETTPVFTSTIATSVLLLLHVPPNEASLNVVPEPKHIFVMPDIADGAK
jgi:hypothetical protein